MLCCAYFFTVFNILFAAIASIKTRGFAAARLSLKSEMAIARS
ncbi:MAG: hypothetical protein WBB82_07850 [Limnothrix sp.]